MIHSVTSKENVYFFKNTFFFQANVFTAVHQQTPLTLTHTDTHTHRTISFSEIHPLRSHYIIFTLLQLSTTSVTPPPQQRSEGNNSMRTNIQNRVLEPQAGWQAAAA